MKRLRKSTIADVLAAVEKNCERLNQMTPEELEAYKRNLDNSLSIARAAGVVTVITAKPKG